MKKVLKTISVSLIVALLFSISAIPAFAAEKTSINSPILRMNMPVYDHYEVIKNVRYNEGYLMCNMSFDNSGNSGTMSVNFIAQTSGTQTGSFSSTFTASGEMNTVLAKVSASAGVTVANSVSWTEGRQYGAAITVSPGKSGYLAGYIPAMACTGYRVFKVYNSSNDSYFYDYRKVVDVRTPIANSWHIKAVTY